MATLDPQTPEWREALRLVRAVPAAATPAAREAALSAARRFLAEASSGRLRRLARLLPPGAGERAVLDALVPLERVDVRTRVTDADMGLTDSDAPAGAPAAPRMPVTVVADNLRSAFNAGGLFRTADFFGVRDLWLCGYTAGPGHPQVARAALGADAWVPWRAFPDVRAALAEAKALGLRTYALETSDRARDVDDADFRFPAALLLGNERFGLDPDVVAAADEVVAVPGRGAKNSLNVVTAFALAAHAMRRAFERA